MKTKILDGSLYQGGMMNEIGYEVNRLTQLHKTKPGIAFVAMTGHEPLLKYTIGIHVAAAKGLGFNVLLETRPQDVKEKEVLDLVDTLNKNDAIHAIVLLQPLPLHLSSINITRSILPEKEVEGFHPVNMMDTAINGLSNSRYPMCLPVALIELFRRENIKIKKNSDFVFVFDEYFFNNPFTRLIARNASSSIVPDDCAYTMISSNNEKLRLHCKRADYLFIISKQVWFLKPEWLKKGVCIVDVYSNLVNEVPSKKDPSKMVPIIRGGVNTDSVTGIASVISPVPGGLMQILLAVLFRNSLMAFKGAIEKQTRMVSY